MTDITPASALPALDFRAIAEEVQRQPDLFAAISADVTEHQVVMAARERRYDGSRVPEARAAQIVALRATGLSLSAIERRLNADHRTVRSVVQAAEEQGLVPGIKEVVGRRMSELAEKTMDVLSRELDSEEPDAQLIKAGWVGVGIAADKLVAAPAPAPQLHLHAHVGAADQDPAAIYAAMLRTADAQSAVSARNSLVSSHPVILDTGADTIEPPAERPGSGSGSPPSQVGSEAPVGFEAGVDGGAGGVEAPRRPENGDGKP